MLSKALDRLLILHEDHEQNASTSTVRLVGSTEANIFASISAGINALYGPLHGGANEAVLSMLGEIRDSGEGVQRFVERVKNKEDGVKLMGFGHRVYKNFDPRAKLVKESADEVLEALGVHDPLLDIAKELEAGRARRRLLHRAQALPERRLLHRRHLQGDGLPDPDVHRAVRHRPAARLDRELARDGRGPARPSSAARSSSTPAPPPAPGPPRSAPHYPCSSELSWMPAPVRGRTSTVPVTELRRNRRPGTPLSSDAFTTRGSASPSRIVTLVPAVT